MAASDLVYPPAAASLRLSPRRPFPLPRRASFRVASAAADDYRIRSIGRAPEPPWLVHPPVPPENPFASGRPTASNPYPLRNMPQASRGMAAMAPTHTSPPPVTSASPPPETSASRAVSALLFMIGEIQRPAFKGQKALRQVSKDRRDSFLWLFRRVFSNSPNLVPMVLLLLSEFISVSAERAAVARPELKAPEAGVAVELEEAEVQEEKKGEVREKGEEKGGQKLEWNFKNWVDIGIREGEVREEGAAVERRRHTYERAIAEGEADSLILCNYAQLLYHIAHEHDRAEHYFKWAAMAEPRDAEAIGHYALFTWQARGDVARAEELFLEALEVDPDSFYHSSNYAWFLWKTGAADTCFPLSPISST